MPEFVIRDQRFACRDKIPGYQLMKLATAAKAAADGDVMDGVAGIHGFLLKVLTDEARPALMAYLDDADDIEFDELETAVGKLMESYSDRPTQRPSPSQPGPQSTGGTSRVVSLSKGTAGTGGTSSTDGRSIAS